MPLHRLMMASAFPRIETVARTPVLARPVRSCRPLKPKDDEALMLAQTQLVGELVQLVGSLQGRGFIEPKERHRLYGLASAALDLVPSALEFTST
jgi:hypothetical protein